MSIRRPLSADVTAERELVVRVALAVSIDVTSDSYGTPRLKPTRATADLVTLWTALSTRGLLYNGTLSPSESFTRY